MFVTKRNGTEEPMQFDKITTRISKIMEEANITNIEPVKITQNLVQRMVPGISTTQIDELACQLIMNKIVNGEQYGVLATRLAISNLHKDTDPSFTNVVNVLANNKDPLGNVSPLVSDTLVTIVSIFGNEIDKMICHDRDKLIDFFGLSTLKKSYLLKSEGRYIERPQHMFMRVAIGIHGDIDTVDLKLIQKTYDKLSLHYYTHATPTLFHAGTPLPQMASCFLIGSEDSVEGIYGNITDCAKISKWAGGIGIHIHDIRSEGAYIRKTGGRSEGIMPMLKVYDATARYINQSGKRNGSFAMYIEPWHPDIIKFLHAKRAQGVESERARDLFYALWIPDLFMKRVQKDQVWSLMCPDLCPGLSDVYGDEFEELYEQYEKEEKYTSQISARKIWENIITAQIESGVPYMLYKDACNKKSNQKNIGTIKSSNLCAEIVQYSDDKSPSVCNLASISLKSVLKPSNAINGVIHIISKPDCFYCKLLKHKLDKYEINYVDMNIDDDVAIMMNEQYGNPQHNTVPKVFAVEGSDVNFIGGFWDTWELIRPQIDHNLLSEIAGDLTVNLNNVIDKNFYPLEGAKNSNMRDRPIGIGVQGLADVFAIMMVQYDSDYARKINKEIFETIYYGAMKASIELAKVDGPYSTYEGSPLSQGKFQFDLWEIEESELSGIWDWNNLRKELLKHGARNSLLTALMPTASTAQMLGNVECFEAFTSNLYTRSTLAGDFIMVNKYLMEILGATGKWNEKIKDQLVYYRGSIQDITDIPTDIKNVFKTIWEISQKKYIEMSAERGPFIDQSQSLNIWFSKPTFGSLYKSHMLSWNLGLKTGSYYVRQLPASNAQRLGMKASVEKEIEGPCLSCSA